MKLDSNGGRIVQIAYGKASLVTGQFTHPSKYLRLLF
jgi:hypothetical protein